MMQNMSNFSWSVMYQVNRFQNKDFISVCGGPGHVPAVPAPKSGPGPSLFFTNLFRFAGADLNSIYRVLVTVIFLFFSWYSCACSCFSFFISKNVSPPEHPKVALMVVVLGLLVGPVREPAGKLVKSAEDTYVIAFDETMPNSASTSTSVVLFPTNQAILKQVWIQSIS